MDTRTKSDGPIKYILVELDLTVISLLGIVVIRHHWWPKSRPESLERILYHVICTLAANKYQICCIVDSDLHEKPLHRIGSMVLIACMIESNLNDSFCSFFMISVHNLFFVNSKFLLLIRLIDLKGDISALAGRC
jgi:hypothetical protein